MRARPLPPGGQLAHGKRFAFCAGHGALEQIFPEDTVFRWGGKESGRKMHVWTMCDFVLLWPSLTGATLKTPFLFPSECHLQAWEQCSPWEHRMGSCASCWADLAAD